MHLHTRRDGVVALVSADGAPAFQAAATWVIFHRTSCSRSIDYELVGVAPHERIEHRVVEPVSSGVTLPVHQEASIPPERLLKPRC